MKYSSTRGKSPSVNFIDVLTSGVAPDGGLYIPDNFPIFSSNQIQEFENLSYQDLAKNIIHPFLDDFLDENELEKIIKNAYASFRKKDVVHLVKDKNLGNILET